MSPEEEMEGLDMGEHGMEAYGDFMLRSSGVSGAMGIHHERATTI